MREINYARQESSALSTDEEYPTKKLKANKEFDRKLTAEHLEKTVKQECKSIRRIRARSSYSLFRELYNFLEGKPSIMDILWKFYSILDARHSFGSRTSASYAAESLGLVLRDKGELALKHKGGEVNV